MAARVSLHCINRSIACPLSSRAGHLSRSSEPLLVDTRRPVDAQRLADSQAAVTHPRATAVANPKHAMRPGSAEDPEARRLSVILALTRMVRPPDSGQRLGVAAD
jgi:hypothetical protein